MRTPSLGDPVLANVVGPTPAWLAGSTAAPVTADILAAVILQRLAMLGAVGHHPLSVTVDSTGACTLSVEVADPTGPNGRRGFIVEVREET